MTHELRDSEYTSFLDEPTMLPENKIVKKDLLFAVDRLTGKVLPFATKGLTIYPLSQAKETGKMKKGEPRTFTSINYFGPQEYFAQQLGAQNADVVAFGNINELLTNLASSPNSKISEKAKEFAEKFSMHDTFDLNDFGKVLAFIEEYTNLINSPEYMDSLTHKIETLKSNLESGGCSKFAKGTMQKEIEIAEQIIANHNQPQPNA